MRLLVRMIRRPHHRPHSRVGEPHRVCLALQHLEHIRMRITQHRKMMLGRLQILPYRSEEHTSELQSLMRISYAVFCLKKKNNTDTTKPTTTTEKSNKQHKTQHANTKLYYHK